MTCRFCGEQHILSCPSRAKSRLTPAEMDALNKRRDDAIREEIIGEWGEPLRLPELTWGDWVPVFAHRIGLCGCTSLGECERRSA